MKKIKINPEITEILLNIPENGMGYHIVDIILKDKDIKLNDRTILNCTYLLIDDNENYEYSDIERIEIK